jgi:hypothetical protein
MNEQYCKLNYLSILFISGVAAALEKENTTEEMD